jgi:hypothetical protein
MISPTEQAKIKALQELFMANAFQVFGQDIPEELQAQFVGTNMATLDALFAIREGTAWRGITDPQEIAREVLRAGQIGDPAE